MLEVDVHEHHRLERLLQIAQQFLQGFGLRNVARKPVENESFLRVGLRQPLADHAEHGGIIDQFACIHGRFGPQPQLRRLGHRLAQQIARRYLRHAVGLYQHLGLGALARSGCP